MEAFFQYHDRPNLYSNSLKFLSCVAMICILWKMTSCMLWQQKNHCECSTSLKPLRSFKWFCTYLLHIGYTLSTVIWVPDWVIFVLRMLVVTFYWRWQFGCQNTCLGLLSHCCFHYSSFWIKTTFSSPFTSLIYYTNEKIINRSSWWCIYYVPSFRLHAWN